VRNFYTRVNALTNALLYC